MLRRGGPLSLPPRFPPCLAAGTAASKTPWLLSPGSRTTLPVHHTLNVIVLSSDDFTDASCHTLIYHQLNLAECSERCHVLLLPLRARNRLEFNTTYQYLLTLLKIPRSSEQ